MNSTFVQFCALLVGSGFVERLAAEPDGELLPAPRPILTLVQEVRRLSTQEADRGLPVRLTGVVTHANPFVQDFFVQDGTAGIYVNPTDLVAGLTPGDEIALEGFSSSGDFAPCVNATMVRKLGRKSLPEPQPFDLSKESSRWLDGQWIQAWCVVRSIGAAQGYTLVTVSTLRETAMILIPGEVIASQLATLRYASVRIRAVCVPSFSEDRIVTGPPRLFISSLDYITVLRTAEENRSPPAQLIDRLYGFLPEPDPGSRSVKVRGVVTGQVPAGPLFIQDATGAVVANLESSIAESEFAPGDEVEAIGFLEIHDRALILHQAQVRRIGLGQLPEPTMIGLGSPRRGIVPGTRIQCEGTVEETRSYDGSSRLVVRDLSHRIECVGHTPDVLQSIHELKPGTRIQITGVLGGGLPTDSHDGAILIPSVSDLVVLHLPDEPSWWTPKRIVLMLGTVAALAFLTLFWNASLRKRVQGQTEQIRKAFERQSHLESQLKQSQKMEAIGRLAGGIAHDFNNLLTVINGCTDLLLSGQSPELLRNDLLGDISRAGEKAATLTSQLLVLSKHRVMQLASIHLNESISEAVKLLRRVIAEPIEIRTDYAENLPPILAEKGMIHQILLNLAVNARDAMPGGGAISISTSSIGESTQHWVRLTIADNGHGMDAATQSRIFEPFFTTKPVGQGTGLGLATVYGLVQALQGRIGFQSEVGYGTRFEIDFPPSDQPVAPIPTKSHDYPTAKHNWRLLVVEDDPAVQRFVQLALQQAGFVVTVANDPLQAIQICENRANEFDLLVTDLVMPEMTGKRMAEIILELRPHLRILFMSGYSPEELRVQGMSMDDWPFLQKPFPPSTLVEKAKEMLNDSWHRLKALR